MLFSLALILLCGMLGEKICQKLKLPPLLGMLITGIILGPSVFNQIDTSILNVSADLRKIALIIILIRAGLTLNLDDLKKVGRPALLMCFVPACFELTGSLLLGPTLLHLTVLESAILGSVLAAVSPAVIVPKMVQLIEEGYGKEHSIPQLILAGASVDDVVVIILFSTFTSLAKGGDVNFTKFINIPISIVLGILIGLVLGKSFAKYFKKYHLRDTSKVFIFLAIAFILCTIEDNIPFSITFSALLAIMAMGIGIQKENQLLALRLSTKFNKLWIIAQIFLFILVGASVDLTYLSHLGIPCFIFLVGILFFRSIGVLICLIKTKLNKKERIFCMIAYLPKATVQASIGGLPMAMGLACGDLVLTMAVLAILITAPLGAFLIDHTYQKLLTKD